ncbi:hypothetical protein ACFP3U_26665 [Kitasatospora misakiensis]|uniref:Lantibiotic n=1 Tax=Kitasatospora misakiensis TaxID=67330 RepID=A0ABW0X7M1_9ACTN
MTATAVLQAQDQLAEFDLDIRLDAEDLTPLDPRMGAGTSAEICTVTAYCGVETLNTFCNTSHWGAC